MVKPSTSPMFQQYLALRSTLPQSTILLYELGDFYEAFKNDAEIVSAVCDVTLTSRRVDQDKDGVPMAGFPKRVIENYLGELTSAGHDVAIATLIGNTAINGVVPREISRTVKGRSPQQIREATSQHFTENQQRALKAFSEQTELSYFGSRHEYTAAAMNGLLKRELIKIENAERPNPSYVLTLAGIDVFSTLFPDLRVYFADDDSDTGNISFTLTGIDPAADGDVTITEEFIFDTSAIEALHGALQTMQDEGIILVPPRTTAEEFAVCKLKLARTELSHAYLHVDAVSKACQEITEAILATHRAILALGGQ